MESKKRKRLADMSIDDFMNSGLNDSSSETASIGGTSDDSPKKLKKGKIANQKKGGKVEQAAKKIQESIPKVHQHKKSLQKLKETDPDFYSFLESQDKDLLDFNDSGSDDDEDDDEEEEEEANEMEDESSDENDELVRKLEADSDDNDSDDELYHQPPAELEVASESDEEKPTEKSTKRTGTGKKTLVNMKMLKEWGKSLKKTHSLAALHKVVQAFKAAVLQTKSEESKMCHYVVEDSKVFNGVIRLCLSSVLPTVENHLELTPSKDPKNPTLPDTSPRWRRVKPDVQAYLKNLLRMVSGMAEAALVNVLLRHIHQLLPYCLCFPRILKNLMKMLINTWCTAEETTRVLAFVTLIKLVHMRQDTLLEPCIKKMYMAYIKNCKFTSPTSLPLINFMQRCLVELFAIDVNLAYQYTFIYIRQLAIHLRNALTIRKKETCQSVYNWQYIHSLTLWVRLLSTLHPNDVMDPLIYPLVQTIIGTVKLAPTARYYPLRFHCIRALNKLSESTSTFIPVLPLILEVLESTDFNKRHKSSSFKPFNFACILKFSKAQIEEKGFKDGLVEQLYDLFMEHFHIHSHTVGFPELALPAVIQIKDFIKKCKVANFTKQLRQILEKVEETSKTITQRRTSSALDLKNLKAVDAWEVRSKTEGTPLSKYYATWRKLRDRELMHEIAGKERIVGDDRLPSIERPDKIRKASEDDRKEFSELFDTESDESEEDDTRFLLRSERPKKKKTKKEQSDSDSQEYSDFDSDELEQLAGSASGGSDDDDDDDDDENDDVEMDDDEDDAGDSDESDEIPDKEDIVEDFAFSDDDN
ncbi:nucleolar complex protein 2 homolog isoform X2 [Lineus longissimus]|uniref:nucleolar complex protein 2 homolog isoform X2 n=1 Tax=Lineus longissimus TaxID=88925 RepID=UPI00315CE2A6